MSSRAVRRLQRDQDIIVIPETSNTNDDSQSDTDIRSNSKPKNKKAVNLFAQVETLTSGCTTHHLLMMYVNGLGRLEHRSYIPMSVGI